MLGSEGEVITRSAIVMIWLVGSKDLKLMGIVMSVLLKRWYVVGGACP